MVDDAEEREPLLRVARIEVEGLFGLYHHRIELKLDERVTILHGPNGVGKTMLLRMVDDVLAGQWYDLCAIPFRVFLITFNDGTLLRAVQSDDKPETHKPTIDVALAYPGGQVMHHAFEWPRRRRRRMGGDGPLKNLQVEVDDAEGLPRRMLRFHEIKDPNEPSWLTAFRGHVDTHLIGVERLTDSTNLTSFDRRTVQLYAAHLADRIEQTQALYGRQSQRLDQTFPQRLVESSADVEDTSVLRSQMEELDRKRNTLSEIGLLDEPLPTPFKVDSLDEVMTAKLGVMALYARDTADKLSVFDDLAGRIALLLDIINAKLRHKRLRIDRKKGLVIEPVGYEGPPIELDALSSGEQHELVLHYDLLFCIRPNTLVLIDEPELSLHVVWQKRFLPDLLRIVAVAGIDVLVATHSPYIIGEHRDLMVGLSDDLP